MAEQADAPDDGRTPEERQMDKALKATFPASDPPSFSSGTATPQSDDRRAPDEKSHDEEDPEQDHR